MISQGEVEHVARLARLALQPEETRRFTEQLNAILTYMEQLHAVDTEAVEPTAHVLDLANVFRDDVARPTPDTQDMLANAPEVAQHYVVVPRIVE